MEDPDESGTDPDGANPSDRRSVQLAKVSRPRRRLIVHLAEQPDRRPSVSELAETLLRGSDEPDLLEGFELQLHHVHLPALEDAGLIQYDPDARRIVSTAPDALTAAVEYLDDEE